MYIQINNHGYIAREGQSILEFCNKHDIPIPNLCYNAGLKPEARCRICVVEVNGKIQSACNTMLQDQMEIHTNTPHLRKLRKMNLELMMSQDHSMAHDDTRESDFAHYAREYGAGENGYQFRRDDPYYIDTNPSLIRDSRKCILCGKCVQACQDIQGVTAIGFTYRSHESRICPAFEHPMAEVACALCGQCANVCPTGAIQERSYLDEVKEVIADPDKFVVVQTAPAVRASIGETQAIPPGTLLTGQLVTALKQLGFDRVLDTNFAADLTIMEEGTEFIERVQNGGTLPLITSCSPGWIRFIEYFYPELLPHVSSCKSPQQMFGATVKTYYAQKHGIDPGNMVSVSIMPCTAKKFEMQRDEMNDSGFTDVDYVLTTRELGRWLNEKEIDLLALEKTDYDPLMGSSTGAAVIFGTTGGVMEAALRTVADILENKDLPQLDYEPVRGFKGIKEAQLRVAGIDVSVAVAHGLKQARTVLEWIKTGERNYHFVEVMACPGGCIGGGGQPKTNDQSIREKRAQALYQADRDLPLRKSHQNPEIIALYEQFFDKPGSKKAHHLLHTHYVNRKVTSKTPPI